jgi:hypothetical protein
MSFRPSACRSACAALLVLTLAGCNAWQDRAEFAPPQYRWGPGQSSPVMADAPPPPIPMQYCYRTLATVDCYNQTMPERLTGYTGLYPDPASLPPGSKTPQR